MDPMLTFEKFLERLVIDTVAGTPSPGLGTSTIGMYNSPLSITPETTKADLDAASMTFHGYAPQAGGWTGPTLNEAGVPEALTTLVPFTPTDSVVDENAYGAYCWNGFGLVFAGPFSAGPYPMASPLNQVTMIGRWDPIQGFRVLTVS